MNSSRLEWGTAQIEPHVGPLPVPHVLLDAAYVCVCFMKYMLEQEGRVFHVPIIYPLFQINASEASSWHTVGSLSLQAGPGPRFCSLFSARSAKVLHSPPAQKSFPPKLQFFLYRYHSTAIYSGASTWALTKRVPFLPMTYWDARQRQLRHISVGVLVVTSLHWDSVSSVPRGNFQPCLFSSLYLKPLLCNYYCIGGWESLFPLLFSVRPKRCFVQFPNSGDGAVQTVNTRAQTYMALAIIWLHILLKKLLDKLPSKPSYRNLQYSSAPREGRLLFLLLCVTFKRKERLSCCWGVPLGLENTQSNGVQRVSQMVCLENQRDWQMSRNE